MKNKGKVIQEVEKISRKKKKTGTKEWASENYNFQKGCQNGCKYCYAHAIAAQYRRVETDWTKVEINLKKICKKFSRIEGRYMFPTTHDITKDNLSHALKVLNSMLSAGNEVLIVSKPRLECIKTLCEELKVYKDKIEFRFSIGSASNDTLKFWEPNAPSFEERLESLKYAFEQGFTTSVSLEPFLDEAPNLVVDAVLPYIVTTIWLGEPKMLMPRLAVNGHKDAETLSRARRLLLIVTPEKVQEVWVKYSSTGKLRLKDGTRDLLGEIDPVAAEKAGALSDENPDAAAEQKDIVADVLFHLVKGGLNCMALSPNDLQRLLEVISQRKGSPEKVADQVLSELMCSEHEFGIPVETDLQDVRDYWNKAVIIQFGALGGSREGLDNNQVNQIADQGFKIFIDNTIRMAVADLLARQ